MQELLNPAAILAHVTAATEQEVDNMDTVDVEDCKYLSAMLWVGTKAFIMVSKLDNMSNFPETTALKKSPCPLLEHVSLQKMYR